VALVADGDGVPCGHAAVHRSVNTKTKDLG
jgi:hypothetical protein